MFTGIVEKTVRVIGVADGPAFRRLTLALDWPDLADGESVAVNGCCLTVADRSEGEVGFDVVAETLAKTNLGALSRGQEVHVERSLRVGDRISGHFVQGHVDATAPLLERHDNDKDVRLKVQTPHHLAKYIAPKGSVAIDGVSLTVAAVHGSIFEVAIIPTTLQVTTLGRREPGYAFNFEADILSKTVVTWLERREGQGDST